VTRLAQYGDLYPNVRMSRDDQGILEVTLHSGGDSLRWTWDLLLQLGEAFRDIARDPETRVVVMAGTGHEYVGPRADDPGTRFEEQALRLTGSKQIPPQALIEAYRNTREMQNALLDISVPVVGAVNGPVLRHCELALWSDVIVASEDASFEDSAHFELQGMVPGDGMQIVATMLMGVNRARSFLLTGEVIDAEEAKRLGMVAEVRPKDEVLDRAREIARQIAKKPDGALIQTRALITHPIKKQVLELSMLGLQMAGLANLAQRQ
jgi:enoyl-CoA hydratase/carnithine racemase